MRSLSHTRSQPSRPVSLRSSGRSPRPVVAVIAAMLLLAMAGLPIPRPDSPAHAVSGVVALVNSSAPDDGIYAAQFCGGVLITGRMVLTAAHCIAARTAGSVDVIAGTANLCDPTHEGRHRVHVATMRIHPGYDADSDRSDLALLTLEHDLPRASTRALADAPELPAEALAAGWGVSADGGAPPCDLRIVHLRLLTVHECAARAAVDGHPFDPTSMLCALPNGAGSDDTCAGDSGGPLFLGTNLELAPVIGITSWGRGCGLGYPGVYARDLAWAFTRQPGHDQAHQPE